MVCPCPSLFITLCHPLQDVFSVNRCNIHVIKLCGEGLLFIQGIGKVMITRRNMIQLYSISSTTASLFTLMAYSVYRIAQRQKMMQCQNVNNSYHALAMRNVSVKRLETFQWNVSHSQCVVWILPLYVNKYLRMYISYHSAAANVFPIHAFIIRSINRFGDDIFRLTQG